MSKHLGTQGNNDETEQTGVFRGTQKAKFNGNTQERRKDKRDDEGDPEGTMIIGQDVIGDKGGKHGHFSLTEVDHFRCLIDNYHGNSKKTVTGADGQPLDNQLSYWHCPSS